MTQGETNAIHFSHSVFIRAVSRCIAIKFTMHYPYIVTTQNIKWAVIAFWIFTLACEVLRLTLDSIKSVLNLAVALVLFSCVLFVVSAYVILYRETLRHKKKIKTQQLPQKEVERFTKESKALKTTVFVVGAVVLCFSPMAFAFLSLVAKLNVSYQQPWIRTFAMLNSLLNPLIYCWRQKEMRQFVFRIKPQAVLPTG